MHESTLDAYFERLAAAAPRLKLAVVTGEIGDSWIYGAPATPYDIFFDKLCIWVSIRMFGWLNKKHSMAMNR